MQITAKEVKRFKEFCEQVKTVLLKRLKTNDFERSHIMHIVFKAEGEIYSQMRVGFTPVEVANDLYDLWTNGDFNKKFI